MAKTSQSKMIEIECPSCKAMLELDRGFAGGVCRCSKCGTLMTVPEDPSREKAETLSRPDAPGGPRRPSTPPSRPSAPTARPDNPSGATRAGMPSPRPTAKPTPSQPPAPQRPQTPVKPAPPKPSPLAPPKPVTPPPAPPKAAPIPAAPQKPVAPAPAPPKPAPPKVVPSAPSAPVPQKPAATPAPKPPAPAPTQQAEKPAAAPTPPAPVPAPAPFVSSPAPSAAVPIVPPPAAPAPIAAAPVPAPTTPAPSTITPPVIAPPVIVPAPQPESEIEPLLAEEDSTVLAPEPQPLPILEPVQQAVSAPQPTPTPEPAQEPEPQLKAELEPELEPELQPTGSGMKAVTSSGLAAIGSGSIADSESAQHPPDAFHAAEDEEVFVTASGKIIRVKKNRIVTAQTKRKVIRAGIIVAITAVFVVILIIGGIAIIVLSKDTGPDPKELERQRLEARNKAFGFDLNKNPYTLTYPNYVGIKLKPNFVIILDASSTGSGWFGDASDAVEPGLKTAHSTVTGQVAVAADGGPKFYPAEPKPIDSSVIDEIANNLRDTFPSGSGDIVKSVDASLAGNPKQIIIVTNETAMRSDLADKLQDLLKDRPDVVVDLIVMEGNKRRADMEAFVQARKGEYALLPVGRLKEWKKDAP